MSKKRRDFSSRRQRQEIRKDFEIIKEALAIHFKYQNRVDSEIIDFTLLSAVALRWRGGNPLWTQIIGAPGSGKTAHLELLKGWKDTEFVSRLSSNSLISGYKEPGDDETDYSFLPLLDNKLLIVKDFTTILQGPREERDSVIGQLRDIYDGHASRVMGNVGKREYESKFNMILATTYLIDGFHSINQQLGERFISRREYSIERNDLAVRAFHNAILNNGRFDLTDIRTDIRVFLSHLPICPLYAFKWPQIYVHKITMLADFIALARSHVTRERDGRSISGRPSPEVATRLVTQMGKAISAYCLINGIETINRDAWAFTARLMRDTLPAPVAWTLYNIYEWTKLHRYKGRMPMFNRHLISTKTKLGFYTNEQIITDLYLNGILGAEQAPGKLHNVKYYMLPSSFSVIKRTGLFNDYEHTDFDLTTMRNRIRKRERRRSDASKKKKTKDRLQSGDLD
jgi:hypothetical protein